MSEIASKKKKKRNEFLISSAEKKYRLFNSISVILQHSHLFQAEWVFFSLSLFFNLACTSQDFERCPKNLIICSVEQKYLMY